jgi:aminoglycoside phosphotransferase (APT) family kinase protein
VSDLHRYQELELIHHHSWEMSTVGHPLADLIILTQPWTVTANSSGPRRNSHPAFQPGSSYPGLPSKAQCIAWYRDAAGWNPEPDILWGDAFSLFRTSIVMQGIAARYAVRQASGEGAYEVGQEMFPFAEMAWKLVGGTRRMKVKDGGRTKL